MISAFRHVRRFALLASLSLLDLPGQAPVPAFRADVELLSVSARVTDRNNSEIHHLTADQFTLLENGVRQRISFFAAEEEPVSLGVLLDVSSSMSSSGKLESAKAALVRMLDAVRSEDELLYLEFHRQVDKMVDFTTDARQVRAAVAKARATEDGTSLYDSIARALCYMRASHHHKRAILVITDGADEHSHRTLEELIPLVQASQTQLFLVGYFAKAETDAYQSSGKKVTLATSREIDNTLRAFRQLSDESGAESFFPHSPATLQDAVDAVAHELRTQYTLAYYPRAGAGGFRRIEVRIARAGARVRTRRGFAASAANSSDIDPGGCEGESPKPYSYESKVGSPNGCLVYREDFQDRTSGWPITDRYHYASGAYQIDAAPGPSHVELPAPPVSTRPGVNPTGTPGGGSGGLAVGTVVANGPYFDNFDASVKMQLKPAGADNLATAAGLVFRLNSSGYYAVVVSSTAGRKVYFKLVRKYHSEPSSRDLTQWTAVPLSEFTARFEIGISVQVRGGAIRILIQGQEVGKLEDDGFERGLVGLVFYGKGRAIFRDLLASEACTPHPAMTGK